jgi:sulfatase modifying factor 1
VKSAMVELEGGRFLMGNPRGDGYPQDGEEPVHEVALSPFSIGSTPVTNAGFAAFAEDTGYQTGAEKTGWSFVFTMFLPEDFEPTRAIGRAPWWRQVFGAQWRHPEGPQSDIAGREDHPVTHVSWDDANAYCDWAELRLPTEAEWEFAARGGIAGAQFPWGDELEPDGRQMMNVFQGEFPAVNTCEDGWAGTSPVGSFEPNGYGLFDVTGNVWEWCADRFSANSYREGPRADPVGPPAGDQRVIRGGSYLCHASYCRRYRVDARSSNTPDSTSGNTGFRVAASR